ncbi:hypothetical protein BESB_067920 [Besnoitia besnoiti]|uniref:Peptide deformylase n=1 Tax=Besnoitia besnoiti TaxID=94643 RepID=A0A2A9MA33_BESBE|nr:hypothetical protein BESB_067920 [Besnoitia besnoiti]PFH34759.1 hypothetical protein BESB_067920 [Besnoitia besnoiti]
MQRIQQENCFLFSAFCFAPFLLFGLGRRSAPRVKLLIPPRRAQRRDFLRFKCPPLTSAWNNRCLRRASRLSAAARSTPASPNPSAFSSPTPTSPPSRFLRASLLSISPPSRPLFPPSSRCCASASPLPELTGARAWPDAPEAVAEGPRAERATVAALAPEPVPGLKALEVLTAPHPLLRRPQIAHADWRAAETRATAEHMLAVMYREGGVGLAAPQVGLDVQLIVWNPTGSRLERSAERVFLNPRLVALWGPRISEIEGCLSFPGVFAPVERPLHARVAYTSISGADRLVDLSGLEARIVQHEIDHLQGILFVDRVSKRGCAVEAARLMMSIFALLEQWLYSCEDIRLLGRRALKKRRSRSHARRRALGSWICMN